MQRWSGTGRWHGGRRGDPVAERGGVDQLRCRIWETNGGRQEEEAERRYEMEVSGRHMEGGKKVGQ
jgi:hypothetical protein